MTTSAIQHDPTNIGCACEQCEKEWDESNTRFSRSMTIHAMGIMIEGLSDDKLRELWEWLRSQYPPKAKR